MNLNNIGRFDNHSHSEYSNIRLIDSTNRIPDMLKTAAKLGMKGIALTDHECLCGHLKWLNAEQDLKEQGIIPQDFKAALGNEIYLVEDRNNIEKYWHYILIAKNNTGHRALRELSSTAWYYGYNSRGMMRVPTEMKELEAIVRKYPNTLIATTACFRKGTLVITLNGEKPIEEITSDDYILNRYGKWEKVNFPTHRTYNGMGRKIYFLENPIPTVCTENHQFLITTNNKIQSFKKTGKTPVEWIEAKDLNTLKGGTKHICLFPVNNFNYTNKDTLYSSEWKHSIKTNEYTAKKTINPTIMLTPEVMRLFGLWLGDGSISFDQTKNYYCINITFSEEEFDYYWSSFVESASKELGVEWSINKRHESHRVDITSHSVELTELFYYLFGNNKAATRHISQRLLHISKELDFNLFIGYALADGYFRIRAKDGYDYGEFCSASISERLTKDFQDLLKSLGIRSSITSHKDYVSQDGIKHQKSYYLSSSNKAWTLVQKKTIIDNNKILHYMDVAIQHDSKKFIEIDGILYKKVYIKKIEPIDLNEEVYCLNVNSHSFCCNNVIVHNCLGGELPHFVAELVKAEQAQDENEIRKWKMEIHKFMTWNIDLFGDDFYIEIAAGTSEKQKIFNKRIKSIAKAYNRKIIIGSDAHYLTAKERHIHKAYLNSKEGEREVDEFYFDAHMMDNEEAFNNLKDIYTEEEFIEICNNTMTIYDKIEGYNLKRNPIIPEVEVINYLPKNFNIEYKILNYLFNSNDIQERYWVNQCIDSLKNKNIYNDKYLQRLEIEADIIKTVGDKIGDCLFKYFNTFQHFIDLFWNCGSVGGPGRGSSVCFLSNYLLGITQLDPIQWNLKEWRFLNKERLELPKNTLGSIK